MGFCHFYFTRSEGVFVVKMLIYQGFKGIFLVRKLSYNYVLSKDDREVVMENYKGNIYKYPLPKMPGPV